jgi:hypothetical protein
MSGLMCFSFKKENMCLVVRKGLHGYIKVFRGGINFILRVENVAQWQCACLACG